MGFNDRFKDGPTLAECLLQRITHLKVKCSHVACRHEHVFEVAKMQARRDIPVTEILFRCDQGSGGCGRVGRARNGALTIGAMYGEPKPAPAIEEQTHPIFDLAPVKPKPRRWPLTVVRKARDI